ncbi:hypothetical protein GCM10017774_38140 [Lentzea cavernae]|uniref:Uncharacterized protein n=1 Tax=Lentzea cavernae TaxID=2020703 RepID=A0ABQ3MFV7_9PSEU|nr:hypothetical protein GCM10017774_38140 [Lentzea cavernae]
MLVGSTIRATTSATASLQRREVRAKVELGLPHSQTLPRHRLERLHAASSCAEPMCSMSRDPRREEYTICTALAPDAVFTVRTYATRDSLEPAASAQIFAVHTTKPQLNSQHPAQDQRS